MKKSNSGFSLVEFLIVVAIVLIIATIGVSNLMQYHNFKKYIGVPAQASFRIDQLKRLVVQPLVTKRLRELQNAATQACGIVPPAQVTPEEVEKGLALAEKCGAAKDDLNTAVEAVKHFNLNSDVGGK